MKRICAAVLAAVTLCVPLSGFIAKRVRYAKASLAELS